MLSLQNFEAALKSLPPSPLPSARARIPRPMSALGSRTTSAQSINSTGSSLSVSRSYSRERPSSAFPTHSQPQPLRPSSAPLRRPSSATRLRPPSASGSREMQSTYNYDQIVMVDGRPPSRAAITTPQYKSPAIDLEIRMIERLRAVGARAVGPDPMRFMIMREVFDQIIEQDRVYGPLLTKIKNEYDTQRDLKGQSSADEDVRQLYAEVLLDHARLKQSAAEINEQRMNLAHQLETVTRELDEMKLVAEERLRELKSSKVQIEEQQQKTNGAWTQQLTLEQKIQQLEQNVQDEARLRKNMIAPDVEELMSRNAYLENRVRELDAEVSIARDEERKALEQLRDAKVQTLEKEQLMQLRIGSLPGTRRNS